MVAVELRAKLELPDGFRFDWTGLAASDTQGRRGRSPRWRATINGWTATKLSD